jgi:23S rRNA-/tRNA-specific pseudouridylate synthase
MLVPYSWQKTNRNLQAALVSSIAAGQFWARSRGIRFLRHVHRLDADTTGVLLLAKSRGALDTFSDLFESRRMNKVYLAVAHGEPTEREWTCRARLAPDPRQVGRMRIDARAGKEAETQFKLLATRAGLSLIEARPVTGRTHQIRLHLVESGLSIVGDELYGRTPGAKQYPSRVAATVRSQAESSSGNKNDAAAQPRDSLSRDLTVVATRAKSAPAGKSAWLGLRAVELGYADPFTGRRVRIVAPREAFLAGHGFQGYGK